MTLMLYLHPVVQIAATVLALYVLSLGLQRFRVLHLHQKTPFLWKRHVALGILSLSALLAGLLLGIVVVQIVWNDFFITGTHGRVGVIMALFILFGLFSGIYLNIRKQKRILLPLFHGLSNVVLLAFSAYQAVTGWAVLERFVFG